MTIRVQCNCGQVYDLADEMAGQQARCQVCNMVFVVPAAPAATTPTPQNPAPFPQNPSPQNPFPNPTPDHQQQGFPQQGFPQSGGQPQQPMPGAQQYPQQPMGYQPMQQPAPYGQQAMGQQAMGQQAMGQQAMGQQAMGQQAMGQQAMRPQKQIAGIPQKTLWIVGGSLGGFFLLVVIVILMAPKREVPKKTAKDIEREQRREEMIRKARERSKERARKREEERANMTEEEKAAEKKNREQINRIAEHNRKAAAEVRTPFSVRLSTSLVAGLIGIGLTIVGINDFVTKRAELYGRDRRINKMFGFATEYEGRKAEWVGVARFVPGIGMIIFAIYFFFNGAG